ncbi:MAG TPA: hypothetical protein VF041_08200 [Gemmatimonadaceae bacterium]
MRRTLPFATLLLCGCYVTVPLASTSPGPGTRLHVQLTDNGSGNLARYLGPNVISVDGRLLQATDTAMSLSVNTVGMRDGDEQFWKGETVSLPKQAIATVQQKKLSRWRSGLLASALIVGIVAIKGATGGTAGTPGGAGNGGSPK